jgi:hypothetical protein
VSDITDIQAAQAVKIIGSDSTGVEQTPVMATLNGDLSTSDGLKSGGLEGVLTLTLANTIYEVKVGASPLANRKLITIQPDFDMYWGYRNTVTTSTGTLIHKNQFIQFSVDPNSGFTVYLICGSASKTARLTESP